MQGNSGRYAFCVQVKGLGEGRLCQDKWNRKRMNVDECCAQCILECVSLYGQMDAGFPGPTG
jgi:hypothetical protein